MYILFMRETFLRVEVSGQSWDKDSKIEHWLACLIIILRLL